MNYNYNVLYNNVYNYYRNSYAQKPSSRFDSHNKSDLKNIYNSIVSMNKEEPVYMFDRSPELENYSISMKEIAMQFGRDIASMGGKGGEQLFEQNTIYSSDPESAEVSYLPNAYVGDSDTSFELKIDSLAKSQINHGDFLPSDSIDLDDGAYSFDVSTSSSNYELQFSKNSNDTNLSIQTRLARLINNAAIGLSALVEEDGNGNSALIVSSTTPGPSADGSPPFSISDEDTSQMRGIVDYLGIRHPTQNATWANYSINGKEFFSPENKVEYDNKLSITLKKETSGNSPPISLFTKADYESLGDNIIKLAGAYNQFIQNASSLVNSQPRTSLLLESMRKTGNYYSDAMNNLGISRNSEGLLDINEEVLKSSLQSSATNSDIDSLKDFAKSTLRKTENVQLNPMDYVDKRVVAYKDPTKSHFANPYVTSAYSGMLFNSYM